MKRPMGVTVLAVLAIIGGVLQLLAALVLFGITGLLTIPGLSVATAALYAGAGFVVFGGIVMLVLGALTVAFGVGALRLRSWAWTMGVIVSAFDVLTAAYSIITAGFTAAAMISSLPVLIIAGVVLGYLYSHSVRVAFGHEHGFFTANRPMTHV